MAAFISNIALSILFACCFLFYSYFSQLFCLWLQQGSLQIDIDIIFPNRKSIPDWSKWKHNLSHHYLPYHQVMKMMIVTHHLQKQ